MDQKKIGKYIAEKRKALGLTQVQLAEKLNMSNKSVSKWERGVCLPDVSLYSTLCEVLGISLNEFLAGEDLLEKEMIPKSEETIINITIDSKKSRHKSNLLITFLLVVLLVVSIVLANFLSNKDTFLQKHCIVPLTEDCPEIQTANMLIEDTLWLYRYYVKSLYNRMQIRCYWYRDGKMIEEETILSYDFSGNHFGRGMIAVIDDYESGDLKVAVTLEGRDAEYGSDDQIRDEFRLPLNGVELSAWQNTYTRHVIIPQNKIPINPKNNESAFLLMTYDVDPSLIMSDISKKDIFWPNVREFCSEIAEYDYAVFITAKIWFEPPYANYPTDASFKLWP